MQSLQSDEHSYLSEEVLRLLARNRITTVLEFLHEEPEKLCSVIKLSLPQILSIRDSIFKKYAAPLIKGTTLLKNINEEKYIRTGIRNLDNLLGGGLPLGVVIEFCGLADTGKSQLCVQIAINAVSNLENTVLYIDTKGDFSAIRVQQILENVGCTHKDMAKIMLKIKVVNIWTMDELIDLLKSIKNKSVHIQDLSLIIIDSLPSLMFQYLGDKNKVGLSNLNIFVNYSRYLCKELSISIICINIQTRWVDQDVSELEDEVPQYTSANKDNLYIERHNRCLGKYWKNIPALVLLLETKEDVSGHSDIKVTVLQSLQECSLKETVVKLNSTGVT